MLQELTTTLQTLLAVDEMSLNVGDSLERRRLEGNVAEDSFYIVLVVRLALAALAFVLVVVIPAAVCAMGICQPVDVEADDVHWCNKCCAGAFCCVQQAKLPPMRVSSTKILIAVVIEGLLINEGLPGFGVLLLGLTHDSGDRTKAGTDPSVGTAYTTTGAIYAIGSACCLMLAGLAFPVQIFFYWSWIRTISSIIRLPCKPRYRAMYLEGVPLTWSNSGDASLASQPMPQVMVAGAVPVATAQIIEMAHVAVPAAPSIVQVSKATVVPCAPCARE